MTTYSYNITLNDSEVIMLEKALNQMIDHCKMQLDNGEGAPFWAHKQSAQSVLEKLQAKVIQTSGNNFGRRIDLTE